MPEKPSLILHGFLQLNTAHKALVMSGRNPELADHIQSSLDVLSDIDSRTTTDEERINFTFVSPAEMGRTALKDTIASLEILSADPSQSPDLVMAANALHESLTIK